MSLIGVDIGGTHTRVGLVSPAGELLNRISAPTQPERGSGPVIDSVTRMIHQVVSVTNGRTVPPSAIGIGITGPVDVETGIVSNPYTLAGWPPTDVLTPLREAFPGATITIDNDANAAAAGEWWVGAGRGASRFAMITLGTGIGAAFLIDGKVQRSSRGLHGEAGHLPLDPSGPPCYCGARGCWEVLASGTALTQRLNGLTFDASDPAAVDILRDTARWTGLGLVNICATFTPDTIAVGGGLSAHFALMQDVILNCLRQHQSMVPTNVPVRVAQAGDDAGIIGAAFLAHQQRDALRLQG